MTSGSFEVTVPHFCGQDVQVVVKWSSYPGSYWEPPDWDEEWIFYENDKQIYRCPKCGVDLDCDDLFQNNIKVASREKYEDNEYDSEPDFDLEDDERGYEEEGSLDQTTEEQG